MRQKTPRFTLIILLILTLLTACAHAPAAPAEDTPVPTATPEPTPDAATQELIAMFGSLCVTEFAQQLTLDGFEGEVWFVPYRPFHSYAYTQIIQNGETLAQLNSRSHEGHSREEFDGLDSVAFRDLNGDGKTDIVIIERFGGELFASLFFSAAEDTDALEERFYRDDELEKELELRAGYCSVPLTAEWAADMVRMDENGKTVIRSWVGEFDDWRSAYRAVAEWYQAHEPPLPDDPILFYPRYNPAAYALIDIDGDDTPELAASTGTDASRVTIIYAFRDGTLYMPMSFDYTHECEYHPGQNSVSVWMNGILGNSRYFSALGPDGEMHTASVLSRTWFIDPNDNGILDSDEPVYFDLLYDANGNRYYDYDDDDVLNITYRLDGVKISRAAFNSYGVEGYEPLNTDLSLGELMTLLDGYGLG